MKKKEILRRRILCAALSAAVMFSLTGCVGNTMQGSVNLMEQNNSTVVSAQGGRRAVISSEPFSPESKGGAAGLADGEELFDMLEHLEYSSVTCDGLPEYRITFPESGASGESAEYAVNLTDRWVWRNKDAEAELTKVSAEKISQLISSAVPIKGNGVGGGEEESADDGAVRSCSAASVMEFGLRLLQNCSDAAEEGNILLSPLSVISALAMTANGAGGNTLAQLEEVFGMSVPELNEYLAAYREALPEGKKYRLHMANAIWVKDTVSFSVEQDFLQRNADFYQAGLYKAPFDNSTLEDINGWVKDNTDGMIEKILDRVTPEEVMYLVNALAFEAEWEKKYQEDQMRKGLFTREDGTYQDATLMYSSEHQYFESELAEGFLKYYADRKYAFAALLPREGISAADYLESLTGEELYRMLDNPVEVKVNAAVPEYKGDYSAEVSQALKAMGMQDAFDPDRADFSGIGVSREGSLYISRVLHKTFIEIDGQGTKAAAATAAGMCGGAMTEEEAKTVYLDRPFVYLIIDCEEKLPIFLGTMMDVE